MCNTLHGRHYAALGPNIRCFQPTSIITHLRTSICLHMRAYSPNCVHMASSLSLLMVFAQDVSDESIPEDILTAFPVRFMPFTKSG